jgi:glycine cleavage system regulatory protein
MSVDLVLTFIGPDKTGLVEAIAKTVAQHDGNWLESRMTCLAGRFAGVLRVSVPAENAATLREALERFTDELVVVVQDAPTGLPPSSDTRMNLDVVGNDRSGIIRDISTVLAERGISVEEMETECRSAPMSGQAIFHAKALLALPKDLDINELHDGLEEIGHDLMVELTAVET